MRSLKARTLSSALASEPTLKKGVRCTSNELVRRSEPSLWDWT